VWDVKLWHIGCLVNSVSVHADSATDWALSEVSKSTSLKVFGGMDRKSESREKGK